MENAFWDKPFGKWVPHKIVCKCGKIIADGYQWHTGGFIFPSQVTEFALCKGCQAKEDDKNNE
jgi:hypothetical protein